jgi:hypothetical protein
MQGMTSTTLCGALQHVFKVLFGQRHHLPSFQWQSANPDGYVQGGGFALFSVADY